MVESSAVRAVALSIAGSDPSGGAGLQADLKTFHQHGVYGCAVPTLLTVQSTRALTRVEVLPAELVAAQLDALLEDMPPDAVKTGALGSSAIVKLVAERVASARLRLVVDTVRVATHGAALLPDDARAVMLDRLLPLATLVTANAHEAGWLTETGVTDRGQAITAAERLRALGCAAVMVKGGHLAGPTCGDVLLDDGGLVVLEAPRIATRHTHGLGCALSAAICANLARGQSLRRACERAKRWLGAAIAQAPGLGGGHGPIDHLALLPDDDEP